MVSYWIDTLDSQKLGEILMLLYCITLSSSRENQRSAQEVAEATAALCEYYEERQTQVGRHHCI